MIRIASVARLGPPETPLITVTSLISPSSVTINEMYTVPDMPASSSAGGYLIFSRKNFLPGQNPRLGFRTNTSILFAWLKFLRMKCATR